MQEAGSGAPDTSRKSSGALMTYLRCAAEGRHVWYLGQKCHVAVRRNIQMKDGDVSVQGSDLALQFEMKIKDRFKSFWL